MPLDEFRDHLGVVRLMGYSAPSEDKEPRLGRTNIQTIRSNAGLKPLIEPGDPEWREFDLTLGTPSSLREDQGQTTACSCATASGGLSLQFFIRTGNVVKLSWQWLFDQLNGGRMRGTNINEVNDIVHTQGLPLASAYPSVRLPRNPPAFPGGSPVFKEDVRITCSSALEAVNIALMGGFAQGPIEVTGNFENFTGDGVAWGGKAPRTSQTNHSVIISAGVKFLGGDPKNWVSKGINSWGLWGPNRDGTFWIPPNAIDNGAMADDGEGHMSTPIPSGSTPGAVA